jgi:copper chaperone CopZ
MMPSRGSFRIIIWSCPFLSVFHSLSGGIFMISFLMTFFLFLQLAQGQLHLKKQDFQQTQSVQGPQDSEESQKLQKSQESKFPLREEKVTLSVQGLHCKNCIKTLTRKVCQDFHLRECHVSFINIEKELGQIEFLKTESLDWDNIKKTIQDSGYEVL